MRRAEYPSIEEQLDAACKAQRGDMAEQEGLDSQPDRADQEQVSQVG